METVFLHMLNMSITGSYIILAVMLLRLLLKKAPKKYSYLMWIVCAFRLCCPFSFRHIFSIFNLKLFTSLMGGNGVSIEYIPLDIGSMQSPQVSVGFSNIDHAINSSLSAAVPEASANPMQIILFIAAAVWLIGIAVLLLYSIISYIVLHVKLKNAIFYRKNIYQSDKVNSPFVFGLINPKIYIPFHLDDMTMTYAIAHEQYHIKRRDYIIKPIAFLILTLHWFNPLCWIAFALMNSDMEMSCDEKILSANEALPKEYSYSLLSFAANKRLPSPCPLAFGESGIKGRIKNILKYKKPKIYVSFVSIILCITAIFVFASNPKEEDIYIIMSEEELSRYCGGMIGSIMADIDYVDNERVVFHYADGLFVYNLKDTALELCMDLSNLNIAAHHPSLNGTIVEVDIRGNSAYLTNYYGSQEEIKDFDNYMINLKDGSARQYNSNKNENLFDLYYDTYTQVPDAKGWVSNHCIINNGNIYYLTIEDSYYVGEVKLVTVYSDGTISENKMFNVNYKTRTDIE